MTKIVFKKVASAKGAGGKKDASVTEKRVRDTKTGGFVTVRTLDGHSKTFGEDLSYVFARNVAKARRDNKKVSGVADRVPAKP